jgi:hypothetical protein
MMFAAVGLGLITLIFAVGVFYLIKNIRFGEDKHYRYEKFTDKDGNVIEKVVDLNDVEQEKN